MFQDDMNSGKISRGTSGCASIPVVEEEAFITKRTAETERVIVRTRPENENVVLREQLVREHVQLTRVPVNRAVSEMPQVRTDGDLTIIPVLEERLVVEKQLFLVEELHLRRTAETELAEVPATLRNTRVEIDRQDLHDERDR